MAKVAIKHVDSDGQNGHTGFAMMLTDYLTEKNIDAEVFGDLIGVGYSSVCRYLRGKRTPSFDVMRKIIEVTGGSVTADDFYKKPDAPIPSKGNRKRQASLIDPKGSFPVSSCDKCKNHTSIDSHAACKNGSPKISPPVQGGV